METVLASLAVGAAIAYGVLGLATWTMTQNPVRDRIMPVIIILATGAQLIGWTWESWVLVVLSVGLGLAWPQKEPFSGVLVAGFTLFLGAGITLIVGGPDEIRLGLRTTGLGLLCWDQFRRMSRQTWRRTRGTLQLVHGLMVLQSAGSALIRTMIRRTEDRIQAVETVYANLDHGGVGPGVDIQAVWKILSDTRAKNYAEAEHQVVIQWELPAPRIASEVAVPLTLIFDELLVNTYQHAFPDFQPGTVHVSLRWEDHRWHFGFWDDGVGIPVEIDLLKTEGSGLTLVRNIAQTHLNGDLRLEGHKGFLCLLDFPALKPGY